MPVHTLASRSPDSPVKKTERHFDAQLDRLHPEPVPRPRRGRDYVAHPEQALLDAGLGNVAPAQLASVAATAVPSLALGAGDPVIGLQRAVANN